MPSPPQLFRSVVGAGLVDDKKRVPRPVNGDNLGHVEAAAAVPSQFDEVGTWALGLRRHD
jgi:hypothetical protein